MAEVMKLDIWEQRIVLTELADTGASYLSTAAGAAFLEQLDCFFASTIVTQARSWGYALDHQEVSNMIVERLLTTLQEHPDKAPIRFAAAADDPWGYLWQCALRWARQAWGTRGTSLEFAEMIPAETSASDDSFLTPLDEVVRLTFEQLAPRVPEVYHAPLLELLGWFAANSPQRLSYEGYECVAAHRHCPSFTIEQVTAVMNIALGGRPRQAKTSLMGQYLRDPSFHPSDSPTHARALTYFKAAFSAGEQGSRMLTDWNAA